MNKVCCKGQIYRPQKGASQLSLDAPFVFRVVRLAVQPRAPKTSRHSSPASKADPRLILCMSAIP